MPSVPPDRRASLTALRQCASTSSKAARLPLPPVIPCRPIQARLAAIEAITWMVAVDSFGTADALVGAGWDEPNHVEAMAGYRRWWHEQLDQAIDSGLAFWRAS